MLNTEPNWLTIARGETGTTETAGPASTARTKKCFKCERILPASEFYRNSKMVDKLLNKCKRCCCAYSREFREKHIDHYRQYAAKQSRINYEKNTERLKKYFQTEAGKAAKKASQQQFVERYPEKRRAHVLLNNAVRDGRITKKPCEFCGDNKSQGHHEDYSKPLEVVWCCQKCHRKHFHPSRYGVAI